MVALFTCSLKLLLCLLVSGSRLIALFIGSLKLVLCLLVSRCAHAMASFVTLRQLFLFFFFKQKTAYEIMPSLVGSEMCIRDRLAIGSNVNIVGGFLSEERIRDS